MVGSSRDDPSSGRNLPARLAVASTVAKTLYFLRTD